MVQVSPMEIRRAERRDMDQVLELANQMDPAVDVEREHFATVFPKLIKDKNACCLLALADDQVQGYLAGHLANSLCGGGPFAVLDEMVVSEELRHSGIGRRLLGAFEDWAEQAGCLRAVLATREAGPFYENHGYARSASYYEKSLKE